MRLLLEIVAVLLVGALLMFAVCAMRVPPAMIPCVGVLP